ncbi:hypothetical protein [Stenotrophomonas acidaminiphila]|uniref:hypothetical protein n=1 Tax=Stenotrophomonas acidaminiphila TaxID=128780 RepID=UPI0028AF164F|nr:hypothetical protein [Stenotrophomonas acidaminiphila]
MTTPPLPPGFVLDPPAPAPGGLPPLPPGFELVPNDAPRIVDLPAVQAQRPDFSDVTARVDSTADQVMGDGWKPGFLRDVAMGGRSVLQGAGSLIGALGGDAFNYAITDPLRRLGHKPKLEDLLTGKDSFVPTASYRDTGAWLADKLGLPKPQSSGERVAGDIGEALTGTGLTLGLGGLLNAGRSGASMLAGRAAATNPAQAAAGSAVSRVGANAPTAAQRAADFLTAQPVLQTVSSAAGAGASGATREAGGGELAQAFAGVAGGLAPSAVTAGLPMTLRGAFRGGEQNRQNLANVIDDFEQLGSTPSIGQGTGSWMRQGVETLLAGGPTSGGVMARFASRQGDEISSGLEGFARRMSADPTAEGAGKAIERGVDAYTDRVRGLRAQLYDRVDQHVPSDAPVALTRTQEVLRELTTPTPGAANTTGAMISPELKTLADNIAADISAAQASGGSGIPYQAVKDIRTQLGDQAFSFTLTPDKPTAQLRKVYRALTDDMQELAKQAGPSAERAVRRANKFYADSRDRLELLQRVVDRNGGPEKVFQAAIAGTREGATVLRQVMGSLPKDAQRDVTAAVIKRMGLANPGGQDTAGEVFSAASFLTNWNKLSPEAQHALFNRFGPEMSQNITKIAQVAERIKQSDAILRSTSGTGPNAAAAGYWGTLGMMVLSGNFGGTAPLIATGALANAVARGMTNPRFVRWLARATELPVGVLPAQVNVLKRMAAENDDEDVALIADALSEQAKNGHDGQDQGNRE